MKEESKNEQFTEQGHLFQQIFESNPQPMWVYDLNTLEFLAVNDAAVQHYGFTRNEFLGMTLRDIRPGEDVPAMLDTLSELRSGVNRPGLRRHRTRDGRILDVHVISHEILFGARQARFVMIDDITETRRANEALKRSEEKYRDLFENANDAIFIVDSRLRFIDANKKAVELLGYTRDALLTMSVLDLIPPEQVPRSSEEFEKLRSHGSYEKFIGKVRTSDGRWLDVEVSSSAIVSDGKVVGSRDIMRDISYRKRMEEELLRAQKLESLGVLAGGIAHDFNNLLTAILGNIALARMEGRPEQLEHAEKAAYRARDLTQQLLTFSRGGAPVKKTVSLRGLIADAASFALRGAKTLCETYFPDDLWNVDADEGQITQVFNNIVINADQAMADGGKIRITCANAEVAKAEVEPLKPGRYVRVSISDRGLGIPEEHLKKIFDPYFTTKQKGSGLGLATSYSIVRQHAGHIDVQSRLGAGSVFTVYLPASGGNAQQKPAAMQSVQTGAGRILIVDDEEMIREVAASILEKAGYETVAAADGQIALVQYVKAQKNGKPFDAVILDVTIPGGMGGKETIEKLLEIDPAAKAIVSSGYSNDPIMAEYRTYGFSGVACKPYSVRTLTEAVHAVLSNRDAPVSPREGS